MSLLLCSVLCAVRNPVACRSRRGDGGARRGIRRAVSASRRQWTGRADRPRVRARSRCLAARARARTRAAALAKSARHGKRCRWESPRDAPPSSASCVRVDARSASIAGVTRAAECDSRACRGTGVAMERRRPGPGLGANDARRVLCGNTQAEGATVADVPRPPVVFAVRVIEDYELCSCVEPFGSFTATRGFFG